MLVDLWQAVLSLVSTMILGNRWIPARFVVGFFVSACSGSRPDFGTLPRVEIPLGSPPKPETQVVPSAAGGAPAVVTTDLPDPVPITTAHQYDLIVQFDQGEISLKSFEAVELALASPSTRAVGRFAFELWSGSALIERVRFDFPLLGAGFVGEEDVLEKGLKTEAKIRVPASNRASRAQILDRKTRQIVEIPWPLAEEKP